jgi:Gly-Xaa carboxypeptidase
MLPKKLNLLVCICTALAFPPVFNSKHHQQIIGADLEAESFQCDLPPVVSPNGDGLPSADELFSNKEAFDKQVDRHSAIVQVPTVSYDDNGDVYEDDRWLVFLLLHRVLKEQFPTV